MPDYLASTPPPPPELQRQMAPPGQAMREGGMAAAQQGIPSSAETVQQLKQAMSKVAEALQEAVQIAAIAHPGLKPILGFMLRAGMDADKEIQELEQRIASKGGAAPPTGGEAPQKTPAEGPPTRPLM